MFRFSGHYARENAGRSPQILACAAPDGTTDAKLVTYPSLGLGYSADTRVGDS